MLLGEGVGGWGDLFPTLWWGGDEPAHASAMAAGFFVPLREVGSRAFFGEQLILK